MVNQDTLDFVVDAIKASEDVWVPLVPLAIPPLPYWPTVENPDRYIDTHAHHGWIYQEDGHWIIEHCIDGEWHACVLGGKRFRPVIMSERSIKQAVYFHLRRAPHKGNRPVRLSGTVHA